MSRVRGRFLKDTVTRWRETPYNAEAPYASAWGEPIHYPCNFMTGGSVQRDREGGEFQPLTTYRCKEVDIAIGDRVAQGEFYDLTPVEGAETVKKTATGSTLRGSKDFNVYTG